MARSFTAAQARQVLETYQEQLRDLRQSLTVPEICSSQAISVMNPQAHPLDPPPI